MSKASRLTAVEKAFLVPTNATHRQYEAMRAFFVDKLPSHEAAAKFGYTPGSFRVLCHQFRHEPHRMFFLPDRDLTKRAAGAAPPKSQAKTSRLRERVVALRKQNFSIYDIVRVLQQEDEKLSAPAVWTILREEGFAKLPRRPDEERVDVPRPTRAAVADVGMLSLSAREFRTDFGGLFLFVPMLVSISAKFDGKHLRTWRVS